VANVLHVVLFLALYLTPAYAPVLSVTSDAALLFYGASMLLAALRGYAGCEVLAVSNWLLGRDDQVGCLLFWPIDHAERRRARAGMSASHYQVRQSRDQGRRSLPGHPDGARSSSRCT